MRASETATAAAMASKFPLPTPGGGKPYLNAEEVISAQPVPTPDEVPSGANLGFGSNEGIGFGGHGTSLRRRRRIRMALAREPNGYNGPLY
jgi:hypothetical protein